MNINNKIMLKFAKKIKKILEKFEFIEDVNILKIISSDYLIIQTNIFNNPVCIWMYLKPYKLKTVYRTVKKNKSVKIECVKIYCLNISPSKKVYFLEYLKSRGYNAHILHPRYEPETIEINLDKCGVKRSIEAVIDIILSLYLIIYF